VICAALIGSKPAQILLIFAVLPDYLRVNPPENCGQVRYTMQDDAFNFDPDLSDLPKGEWLSELAAVAQENGFFRSLGSKHFSAFVQRGDTLVVTFETIEGMRSLSPRAEPMGWKLVREQGWSHLCIASNGDTWFRDTHVYGQFDQLIDDGFFDQFETIVFYGAGPGGYAAAAFSVAAPGSQVVMIQPQATLDPRVTEWDTRFPHMRRTEFTSRYAYAPDMLDACEKSFVLFDPTEHLDGMHAALFIQAGATPLAMRNAGNELQTALMRMKILFPLLTKAADHTLNRETFAKMYRARRKNRTYLRRLLFILDAKGRDELTYLLLKNVSSRMRAPLFSRRLAKLEKKRAAGPQNDAPETTEG
jgi:hypothetical protein